MGEREQLLRAVLENPAEDTVRLVFADWCDENGEGQLAEFIRCAVGEEKLKHTHASGAGGCKRCKMARVVCRYIENVAKKQFLPWAGDDTIWYGGRGLSWHRWCVTFARGFVSEVHLPTAAFLRHAESIFARHPVVRVVLTDKSPEDWGYGWGWTSSIPVELWHDGNGGPDCMLWIRASPQDCLDALSLRCIAYGRERAGLSALPLATVAT
jgi:uncharacterized protein (TIGR02996 family)